MGNEIKINRICKNCGIEFTLTKTQMRQVKSKWAVNCSRSCARTLQHKKNHADKRSARSCRTCGTPFVVCNWDKDKAFCSVKCSAKERFGDPAKRIESCKKRVSKILSDEKYMSYIVGISKSLGFKYGVSSDDILQDFFCALLSDQNVKIEQTAMDTVRREYNRGLTKKRKAGAAHVNIEGLSNLRSYKSFVNSHSFIEYIHDLKSITNENEFNAAMLHVIGVGKVEIEKLYLMPKREMWSMFKRLGL